ncbi:TonB-dependent receptor domain-containing protein [Sphingobium sp.]|uniref:TonB-dependent receptor n=1 Tax=Sphingobium sp. TaxID=1912891 RepID=UPI0028BD6BA4|nr:TonB-dependent receptor [Sphingobium sp.]
MLKSARTAALCAATSLTCFLPFMPAMAQTAPAETKASPINSDEIIVTARRREERQQDIPVAVSAIGAAQLERQNIQSVGDLSGRVPNLLITNGSAGNTAPYFAIRGQSQQDLTALSDPSVSLYIGDVVVPRPLGANLAFFDIANVQVLRGPQGTLFGRNTPGGAVVVTPNAAGRNFEASVAQTVANFGTYITDGMVNAPLGDSFSVRIAGEHKERGGYIHDVLRNNKNINTENSNAARITLDFHPDDAWHNVLMGSYVRARNGGTGSFPIAVGASSGYAAQATRDYFHVASGIKMYANVETYDITDTLTYQLNDKVSLKNIAGYRHLDFHSLEDTDGVAANDSTTERFSRQHQFSNELQLAGDEEWGNWIGGFYYFNEKAKEKSPSIGTITGALTTLQPSQIVSVYDVLNDPFAGLCRNSAGLTATPVPTLGNPAGCASGYSLYGRVSQTSGNASNTSKALFFQASLKLNSIAEGLVGTIGVRQNWDERHAVILNRFVGPNVGPAAPGQCRFFNAVSGDISYANCALPLTSKFREPTYNLSLDWHINKDTLLYAATRHGYRTGGYGARSTTVAGLKRTFQPEKVDDVEVGLKADWHPGNMFLRTNVAAFYAKYRDIQRQLTDASAIPVTTVTTNAGRARIQGIEFEGIFRPVPLFELSGFYSYTDAKFTSFLGPDGIDRSSNPFARAPKHIASVSARIYAPMDESLGKLELGFNWTYQSQYNSSDAWDPRFPVASALVYNIPSYDLSNADIGWTNVMGSNFDVSVYVKNLFDKKYVLPAQSIALSPSTGAGIVTRTPGEPRAYGIRVKYSFGG